MTLEELRKMREGWSPDNFKPLEEVLDLAEAIRAAYEKWKKQ